MSSVQIEHVNVTVRDPNHTAKLLATIFDWRIRWEGAAQSGGYTVHVGGDESYLALYTQRGVETPEEVFGKGHPLNHVGILVSDLDETERRVEAVGLVPFGHASYEPGRRFYFLDPDGTEFEVVSYR